MANPLYPPNALSGNSDCLNEEAVAKFLCNGFYPILMFVGYSNMIFLLQVLFGIVNLRK